MNEINFVYISHMPYGDDADFMGHVLLWERINDLFFFIFGNFLREHGSGINIESICTLENKSCEFIILNSKETNFKNLFWEV